MVKNTLNEAGLMKALYWIISRQADAWISINTCIWIN